MSYLKIEIADNPQSLSLGLMHRKSLSDDSGMLFKFNGPIETSFWGKNTYIPLDIAFIDKNNRIYNISSIAPLSTRKVNSNGFCSMAIETNAGFFRKHGITEGYEIELNNEEKKIYFKKC